MLIAIAPDGGYGWVIVLASFLISFIVDGIVFSYGIFLTVLRKELNATLTQITTIPSVMLGVYLLFGPVISALVNRFGFRWVGFTGGVIASIGKIIKKCKKR